MSVNPVVDSNINKRIDKIENSVEEIKEMIGLIIKNQDNFK
jgi:hypothetical protein